MPRWSTRTMLRELREFKKDSGLSGSETIDDVIAKLEAKFIDEEMTKSLRPAKVKGTKDDG